MHKKKIITDIVTTCLIASFISCLALAVHFAPKEESISVSSPSYKGKNGVSLTFNVYQNTECVNAIIDILTEYAVKGTFFLGGCWVAKNEVCVARLSKNGQEIGSHGYYHYDHAKMSYDENVKEIKKSIEVLKNMGISEIKYFAPPSGSFSDECIKAVNDLDLKMTMWTKDTIDWRDHDENVIAERALRDVTQGDIILMHPTAETVSALPRIIEGILSKGLKILPIGENL